MNNEIDSILDIVDEQIDETHFDDVFLALALDEECETIREALEDYVETNHMSSVELCASLSNLVNEFGDDPQGFADYIRDIVGDIL